MSHPTVDKLITLAAARFGREATDITPGADVFEALGIDSMQVLELLSELELEFDVEIPDWELRGVKTFAELATVIDRRL